MDIITKPTPTKPMDVVSPTGSPPPTNTSGAAPQSPGSQPTPAEVPVAQPSTAAAQPAQTFGSPAAPDSAANKDADKELDSIMNEVNAHQQGQVQKGSGEHKGGRPILVAILALVIALILGVVAFFAFRNTKELGDTGENPPAATQSQNKAATTEDLTKLSQELDKEMAALNDATDFAAADVSDASLGL